MIITWIVERVVNFHWSRVGERAKICVGEIGPAIFSSASVTVIAFRKICPIVFNGISAAICRTHAFPGISSIDSNGRNISGRCFPSCATIHTPLKLSKWIGLLFRGFYNFQGFKCFLMSKYSFDTTNCRNSLSFFYLISLIFFYKHFQVFPGFVCLFSIL